MVFLTEAFSPLIWIILKFFRIFSLFSEEPVNLPSSRVSVNSVDRMASHTPCLVDEMSTLVQRSYTYITF